MDFSWSPLQDELYERILTTTRERLNGGLRERELERRFGHEEWQRCGELGLLGLSVPEVYGGLGLDALTTARALEAFGRGCEDMGLVFSAAAHLFAVAMPILEHGSVPLRQAVLPRLCSGAAIGANAITEGEAGSDVFALRTRAVADGDGYLLNGAKSYVTNGPIADTFLVYATIDPAHGYLGVTAFLVDRDTPGLTVGQPFDKIGLTTSPTSALYLSDCRVPAERRLGDEGQGARIFRRSMLWERSCLFAAWLGMLDRQLERTVEYAKQRRQFGRSIGRNQAVSHKIADMKMRLEAARLLLYRACWAMDRQEDAALEVSLSKLAISEAAILSGLDAIQIHGGVGIAPEAGIERMLRDAIPGTIFSGTSEIQRDLIARALGLG